MATNDIYDSKKRYEYIKNHLEELTKPTETNKDGRILGTRKYYCKNPENLQYLKKMFPKFEAEDNSYIRRCRLIQSFKIIVHVITKNLKDLDREDIDSILVFAGKTMSPKTVSDFKKDTKFIWKTILPDLDEKGRPDETIVPYVVRHLKCEIDKSKQVQRNDRLNYEDVEKLVNWFGTKPAVRAYLALAFESLGRPQELLWRKIKDVELSDNYAKIQLSSHGKEGIGILQCIDSYSHLSSWLNVHPFRNNPEAFLFVNTKGQQFTPAMVNKHLRTACKLLTINKKITCYSLKRNGVTHRRLKGESDVEIQHVARWTSTKQLKIYDLSNQEDAFKIALIRKGVIPAEKIEQKQYEPKTRICSVCQTINKISDVTCFKCYRPLDRQKIKETEHEIEINALHEFMNIPQIQELFKTVYQLKREMEQMKK